MTHGTVACCVAHVCSILWTQRSSAIASYLQPQHVLLPCDAGAASDYFSLGVELLRVASHCACKAVAEEIAVDISSTLCDSLATAVAAAAAAVTSSLASHNQHALSAAATTYTLIGYLHQLGLAQSQAAGLRKQLVQALIGGQAVADTMSDAVLALQQKGQDSLLTATGSINQAAATLSSQAVRPAAWAQLVMLLGSADFSYQLADCMQQSVIDQTGDANAVGLSTMAVLLLIAASQLSAKESTVAGTTATLQRGYSTDEEDFFGAIFADGMEAVSCHTTAVTSPDSSSSSQADAQWGKLFQLLLDNATEHLSAVASMKTSPLQPTLTSSTGPSCGSTGGPHATHADVLVFVDACICILGVPYSKLCALEQPLQHLQGALVAVCNAQPAACERVLSSLLCCDKPLTESGHSEVGRLNCLATQVALQLAQSSMLQSADWLHPQQQQHPQQQPEGQLDGQQTSVDKQQQQQHGADVPASTSSIGAANILYTCWLHLMSGLHSILSSCCQQPHAQPTTDTQHDMQQQQLAWLLSPSRLAPILTMTLAAPHAVRAVLAACILQLLSGGWTDYLLESISKGVKLKGGNGATDLAEAQQEGVGVYAAAGPEDSQFAAALACVHAALSLLMVLLLPAASASSWLKQQLVSNLQLVVADCEGRDSTASAADMQQPLLVKWLSALTQAQQGSFLPPIPYLLFVRNSQLFGLSNQLQDLFVLLLPECGESQELGEVDGAVVGLLKDEAVATAAGVILSGVNAATEGPSQGGVPAHPPDAAGISPAVRESTISMDANIAVPVPKSSQPGWGCQQKNPPKQSLESVDSVQQGLLHIQSVLVPLLDDALPHVALQAVAAAHGLGITGTPALALCLQRGQQLLQHTLQAVYKLELHRTQQLSKLLPQPAFNGFGSAAHMQQTLQQLTPVLGCSSLNWRVSATAPFEVTLQLAEPVTDLGSSDVATSHAGTTAGVSYRAAGEKLVALVAEAQQKLALGSSWQQPGTQLRQQFYSLSAELELVLLMTQVWQAVLHFSALSS